MILPAAITSRRFWIRTGLALVILNEVRGIVTVALTAPVWAALIVGMFHAAKGH